MKNMLKQLQLGIWIDRRCNVSITLLTFFNKIGTDKFFKIFNWWNINALKMYVLLCVKQTQQHFFKYTQKLIHSDVCTVIFHN